MLGKSGELNIKIILGEKRLEKWLEENNVSVIDIKFSVTAGDLDSFLVIYKR